MGYQRKKKKELTEKQQKFIDVLFDEAGGDLATAKSMSGYSSETRLADITRGISDEIIDAAREYLVRNTPRAARTIVNVLDGDVAGARDRVQAAKDIMDRAGLYRTENVSVQASGGVMILPPKDNADEG